MKNELNPMLHKPLVQVTKYPYCILLIDPNECLRLFLKKTLIDNYRVLEAPNGSVGFEMACDIVPDLIISDIHIPEMNGVALTMLIRENLITNHIPIIILTQKGSVADQIEAFEMGADNYIIYPLNMQLLQSKIKAVLANRERCISKPIHPSPTQNKDLRTDSPDEKMLRRLLECIKDKISDPRFKAEDIGEKIGYSRGHLHRKIKAMTGFKIKDLIIEVRLKYAADLLIEKKLKIIEISYLTGFGDTRTFRHHFNKRYGVAPTEYCKNESKITINIYNDDRAQKLKEILFVIIFLIINTLDDLLLVDNAYSILN